MHWGNDHGRVRDFTHRFSTKDEHEWQRPTTGQALLIGAYSIVRPLQFHIGINIPGARGLAPRSNGETLTIPYRHPITL